MKISRNPPVAAVRGLLAEAGLPTEDLGDALPHFLACGPADHPTGVVGIELYGFDALLRSLVVAPVARRDGRGRALVEAAESHARSLGVRRLYLLTQSAERFFLRCGYEVVERAQAPEGIRASREFSALCPASARFMGKTLASAAEENGSSLEEV